MSVTGIGSVQSYIYNARTGMLSSKDGAEDEFVSFFNGKLAAESSETLNGYDLEKKGGIQELIEMGLGQRGDAHNWIDHETEEYEVTCEIINGEKSVYSVNGKQILVQYVPITYSNEELNSLGWAQNIPYQTHQAKAYDPLTSSINRAVGDVFDLRNGYKLSVKEDYIHIEHEGKGNWMDNGEVQQLADGLNALIHFADQQCTSDKIRKEYMPMLLSLLQELGIDTEKEFTLNGTKCKLKNGRIKEVGNTSPLPSAVYKRAMQRYEEELSRLLSHKKHAPSQNDIS